MKDTAEMNGNTTQGVGGGAATLLGVLLSLLPHLEIILRVASLAVGLTIGVITLYRMLRSKRRKS